MSGSGTADDPYVVTNVTELQAMNADLDADYVLGNDVDASATEDWNYERGFMPIGNTYDTPFTGSFDGQNHTISGLHVDRPDSRYAGLFGRVDEGDELENVQIVNAHVAGDGNTGILVSSAIRTDIANVHVEGVVEGGDTTGGIAGFAVDIRGSSARVDVTGEENVGGIAGYVSEIAHSYAVGSVAGDKAVGGLAGQLNEFGEGGAERSFAATAVTGRSKTGGIAGVTPYPGSYANVYWSPEVSGQQEATGNDDSTTDSSVALAPSEMKGTSARRNMALPWGDVFVATDAFALHRNQVESLSVRVPGGVAETGSETFVRVELELTTGESAMASRPASLSTNNSLASANDVTISAGSENGTVNVSASLAGFADATTVDLRHPADLDATNVNAPTAVPNDSTATVDAVVRNAGGFEGQTQVALAVDGENRTSRSVDVGAYASTNTTLSWTPTATGEYDVAVDGIDAGTVSVVARDNVTLTNASAPDRVATGDTFQAELSFRNDADVPVSVPVTHAASGESTTEQVTVAPGNATATVTLTTDASPGSNVTHRFEALGDGSAATTTVVAPADLAASVSVPEAATAGDEVTVEATVSNDGGVAASTPVEVRIDGETLATENVTVGPDGEATVSATTTVSSPGDLSVSVAGEDVSAKATLAVSEPETTTTASSTTQPDDESTTTASTDEEPTTTASDGSPGFGALAAAVALLAAFVARRSAP